MLDSDDPTFLSSSLEFSLSRTGNPPSRSVQFAPGALSFELWCHDLEYLCLEFAATFWCPDLGWRHNMRLS